ncbi:MAG: GntR family transcriptional regulator [Candidatus Bathyarchaeia archaeon]
MVKTSKSTNDQVFCNINLDKESFMPLYRQLAEALRNAIKNNVLKAGEALPSEEEIAKMFGISKTTVRQAILELKREGFVHRYRGRGTFVAFPKFEHPLGTLVSFSEDIRARGMKPSSRILFFGVVPADYVVADFLKVKINTPVLRIYRIRLANQQPVAIHDAYLPNFVNISQEELENCDSLYMLLEKKGYKLLEAKETLEAVAANETQSGFLQVNCGDPLLKVVRVVYTQKYIPIEYVVALYRSDLYRYSIHLIRDKYAAEEERNV